MIVYDVGCSGGCAVTDFVMSFKTCSMLEFCLTLQKAPSARKSAASAGSAEENSSSGLRRSGALGASGSGKEQAAAAAVAVQPGVGDGRSAVSREAGERRRRRTSKNADIDKDTRRSHPRPEAAGDGGVAVSDINTDVHSAKTSDLAANQKLDGSESHMLNGHVDISVAVAKDATSELPGDSRTSAKGRRKYDADVLPLKTSDHKAIRTFAAESGKDSEQHAVNGHKEPPVDVARDATNGPAGAPPSSAEDRPKAYETETDAGMKDDQQVASLPVSIEHRTDIKPVNPDMAIFDVLHRQQAGKRQSGSEANDAQRSPERHDENHSSDIETPTAVINCHFILFSGDRKMRSLSLFWLVPGLDFVVLFLVRRCSMVFRIWLIDSGGFRYFGP